MKMGFALPARGKGKKQQKGKRVAGPNAAKKQQKPAANINVEQIGYAGNYVLNIQVFDEDKRGVKDVSIDIFDAASPAQPLATGLKTGPGGGVRYPEQPGQTYSFTEREKTLVACVSGTTISKTIRLYGPWK